VTDKDGEPVFDIGDKQKLRQKVDPEILSKITNFVLHIEEDEEGREKN
jgi:hypothetical protein